MNNYKQGFALEKAVLLTLSYTDQFNFPLTSKEVWLRLIFKQTSLAEVKISLKKLIDKKLITQQGDYFAIKGSKKSFFSRSLQEKLGQKKKKEVDQFLALVKWLPWVKGIAITGSYSLGVVKPNDDIDFLIITTSHRLWLSRLVVTAIALIKGKRRSWQKEEANSWCFNLWLSEDFLAVNSNYRNIYTAYEVCQARFILDKGGVEERFLKVNAWVKQLLPNYFQLRLRSISQKQKGRIEWPVSLLLSFVAVLTGFLLLLLNKLVYGLQYLYMKPHMTTERVSYSGAFFHPRDTKGMIMKNWQKTLDSLVKR